MLRKLALGVALAATAIGLASSASARTYGGITLSFGSGDFDRYDYAYDPFANDGDYPTYYYGHSVQPSYYDDNGYYYAWQRPERLNDIEPSRAERIEQWRREEARRRYWAHERREHRHWYNDDDDDDDGD